MFRRLTVTAKTFCGMHYYATLCNMKAFFVETYEFVDPLTSKMFVSFVEWGVLHAWNDEIIDF